MAVDITIKQVKEAARTARMPKTAQPDISFREMKHILDLLRRGREATKPLSEELLRMQAWEGNLE